MNRIIALIATVMFAETALGIGGYYQGSLDFIDSKDRSVAISLDLSSSAETKPDEVEYIFDRVHILDATIVIDIEGGPFNMTDVKFSMRSDELELVYRRSQTPANETADFVMRGRISSSGYVGKIKKSDGSTAGTFTLKPVASSIKRQTKYEGLWRGKAYFGSSGTEETIEFQLNDVGGQTLNPANFEFEYTRTKLAHIRKNQVPIVFQNVFINYLSGEILCTYESGGVGGGSLSLRAFYDPETQRLKGAQYSNLGGEVMNFDLERVE